MNFSRLKKVPDRDIEKWIKETIGLTDYAYENMRKSELIRFSGYYFYKRIPIKKHNLLWRLTAPIFLIYCLCLILFIPFKWIITGDRYYSQRYLDSFHYKWQQKMGW